jgi:hypothetical protein
VLARSRVLTPGFNILQSEGVVYIMSQHNGMKTVLIPEELHTQVKALAALESPSKTIQDITAAKLREYVEEAGRRLAGKLTF